MPMDVHSYTAPARVRALLVPLGQLAPERFHQLANTLHEAFEVRLLDVTPTLTQQFNPQRFPSGRVIYDFATALDNQESLFLHDFDPFRKTFVVIGLADQQYEGLAEDVTLLKSIHKSAVVHCAVIFDSEVSTDSTPEKVFFCSKKNSTETVMCDVTRLFLDELSAYLKSYQYISLKSPGSVGSNDRAKLPPVPKNKRISSGASIGLTLSNTDSKISIKTAGDRRTARLKGRQTKVLANLLLLAGNYVDALKEFNEAAVQLKAGNDHLWLGSALEGVGCCILMLTYLGITYQMPNTLANIIVSSNIKSVMSPSPTPAGSPRSSIVAGVNGSDSSVNVNGGSPSAVVSKNSIELERLPAAELIERITMKVLHFYEMSSKDPEDYVPSLVYCESILRYLKFTVAINKYDGLTQDAISHMVSGSGVTSGLYRDIVDRGEILKLSNRIMVPVKTMDILSQTRIYTSLAMMYADLKLERKEALMISLLLKSLIPQLEVQSQTPSGQINDINDVLNTILAAYGVSLAPEASIKDAFSSRWVQLENSVVRLCARVCEQIEDFKTALTLKSLLLTRYLDALTDNEQHRLLLEIQDISRKHSIPSTYFDPFLLRGVYLVRPSNPPKKKIRAVKKSMKPTIADPLIYNPFAKAEVVDKNYLIQDEFAEFLIVVQNPFAFPITINEIKIEGMEVFRNHFTISPKSRQKITILTKPHKSGTIKIETVLLRVSECVPQWFKICKTQNVSVQKKLKEKLETSMGVMDTYTENIKLNKVLDRVETDFLELHVIPAQPSLQLLNVPEPLMLLEGGTHRLQILLKNNSPVSVNIMDYSIWDNTIDPLKRALEVKDQAADEVHEIEHFLYKKSLKILTEFKEIKPFEDVILDLEVQGKRGVKNINLIMDYGHSVDSREVFTRTLEVPITAIVHSSTDLADCDVVPLVQEIDSSKHVLWKFIKDQGGEVSDWCLVLVDIRNLWNKAMVVELECEGYGTHQSIVPMETKRLLVPMRRINLDYENLPLIPSLSGKQYVVPKVSKAEDQYQREKFWYREEILKRLKGKWTAGCASGALELRAIRLSQKILNVLKVDRVSIEIRVKDAKVSGVHHLVNTGEFVTVEVKVTNRSSRTMKGILRNVPSASSSGSIERRLLFNGMLQVPIPDSLKPEESFTLPIGTVFLERGEYEWGAILDEQGNDAQYVCRNQLRIRAL